MQQRTLGTSGLEVSAIGLGCMTMTGGYSGQARPAGHDQPAARAPSTSASRSSTPPRSTARTPTRSSSARRWPRSATRS